MKRILVGTLSVLVAATSIYAEEIRGRVLTLGNQPVAEAIVSAPMSPSVVTDENGYFTLEIKDGVSTFNVWATGYYSVDQLVNGRKEVTVLLVSEKRSRYNEELILPQREDNRQSHLEAVAAQNVAKKDFSLTSNRIDGTLNGRFAGLFQRRMSGMPGEGRQCAVDCGKWHSLYARQGHVASDGRVCTRPVSGFPHSEYPEHYGAEGC